MTIACCPSSRRPRPATIKKTTTKNGGGGIKNNKITTLDSTRARVESSISVTLVFGTKMGGISFDAEPSYSRSTSRRGNQPLWCATLPLPSLSLRRVLQYLTGEWMHPLKRRYAIYYGWSYFEKAFFLQLPLLQNTYQVL